MADIAADVLGKIMTTGKVARIFAVVDQETETAELLIVRQGDDGIVVDRHALRSISRSGYGRNRQYIFGIDEDDVLGIYPQNCSCGAGEVAYYDPMPGETRRSIQTPDWLET